ncbi:hypothetical protein HBI56_202070 [Parastagonospora nodorum]|nr:hypothetical protein HBH56_216600 [Parastagonospora nodorum]KAH3922647.1 hypothetical protein HBH54_220930 [Parastagonospora nodorum]KAH3942167.1 hypothetical protein HBH53_190850 [Parastagonospora nodorum]KAH3963295.1 hypothetical protein HBH52_220590 [Parastagonospora nodorum]KAH3992640.1 hypothetical protein HBI10_216120 [Parastagonospora nodorum]
MSRRAMMQRAKACHTLTNAAAAASTLQQQKRVFGGPALAGGPKKWQPCKWLTRLHLSVNKDDLTGGWH